MGLGLLFVAIGVSSIAVGFTNRERPRREDFERDTDFKMAEVRHARTRVAPIFGVVGLLIGVGLVVASF